MSNDPPQTLDGPNVVEIDHSEPQKRRWRRPVLAVLVAVASGAALVLAWSWLQPDASVLPVPTPSHTPVPDDTANWQTYRNEQYGFEVRYPPDWSIEFKGGSNYTRSVATLISKETSEQIAKGTHYAGDIDLYVFDSIEALNEAHGTRAKDFLQFLLEAESGGEILEIDRIDFYGLLAFEARFGGLGSYYGIFVPDSNSETVYKIFFNRRSSKEQLSIVENRVLSTFKFTD